MPLHNGSMEFSVWGQVHGNKRALFEALKSFRLHYPEINVKIVSDGGDDLAAICDFFGVNYSYEANRTIWSPPGTRSNPQSTMEGTQRFLERIYEHCRSQVSPWVVWLDPDVRTIRRIRTFPKTEIAGARRNPFSRQLNRSLVKQFGPGDYVYGAAGGGIFSREAFIRAFEGESNLEPYAALDDSIARYLDKSLGLLFLINGFHYSVWSEVSEILHETSPVIRDSAFDHGYKYWYDWDFDETLLS